MRPHARIAHEPPRAPFTTCAAAAITALWHGVLIAWLSTQGPRVYEALDTAVASDAIDIVFVPRRAAAAPPAGREYPTITRRPPAVARPGPAPRAPASFEPQPAPEASAEATAGPIDAVAVDAVAVDVIAGDDRWLPSPAAAEPRVVTRPRNRLARVDVHALDVAPRLRVRMRPPRSLEALLKAIAPAGYEADPCPELARAITGLASDAAPESRALLGHAVDFEARYCR